jgi:DNA-binding NarL/FixJ family response regulator
MEADTLLADGAKWRAWFIDIGLPDGRGLEVLARARRLHPLTPAMVLTGCTEAQAINTAYDLRADYVVKPLDRGRVDRFLADAYNPSGVGDGFAAIVAQYGLSEAEADILQRAAAGEDRGQMARARGSSILTVKKQIASMLAKTGSASFQALVVRCLRDNI